MGITGLLVYLNAGTIAHVPIYLVSPMALPSIFEPDHSGDGVNLAVIISICTCEHEIPIVSEDRPGFECIISAAAARAEWICAACQKRKISTLSLLEARYIVGISS